MSPTTGGFYEGIATRAIECPGGKWLEIQSDQRLCPNCGRAVILHRVVRGALALKALRGLRVPRV